ncbi:hypothetical protein F5Y04DRAFT_281730 [Hypomontagnella monticulosa]|nr:hypothetical protein F5Y04DRAFT_281730 [Hypomontagnella monticulosa]
MPSGQSNPIANASDDNASQEVRQLQKTQNQVQLRIETMTNELKEMRGRFDQLAKDIETIKNQKLRWITHYASPGATHSVHSRRMDDASDHETEFMYMKLRDLQRKLEETSESLKKLADNLADANDGTPKEKALEIFNKIQKLIQEELPLTSINQHGPADKQKATKDMDDNILLVNTRSRRSKVTRFIDDKAEDNNPLVVSGNKELSTRKGVAVHKAFKKSSPAKKTSPFSKKKAFDGK